jgi:hypothetical protein
MIIPSSFWNFQERWTWASQDNEKVEYLLAVNCRLKAKPREK